MTLPSLRTQALRGVKPLLLAAYSFSEGSGTTTADVTGNGNDGTLTNGATFGPGKYAGGIAFTGSGQTVDFPYANLQPKRLGVSWCCWAKFPSSGLPSWLGIFGKVNSSAASTRNGMAIENGSTIFYVTRWRNDLKYANLSGVPTDNAWHHYAIADGDTKYRVWLDGVVIASGSRTTSTLPDTNNTAWEAFPWQLGAVLNDFDSMNGLSVSDLRVFSGMLTDQDVIAAMKTPVQ